MSFDIIRAFHDRNLLGAGIRDFSTFKAWETALRAIFGLGFVNDEQRAIYQRCTHRNDADNLTPCRSAVLLCGRRSGKSFMMALCAVWLSLFRFGGKKSYLQRGEVLSIKVIAQDRDAARTILGYIDGLLSTPLLKPIELRRVRRGEFFPALRAESLDRIAVGFECFQRDHN